MSRPNQGEAISIYRGQYILDETPEIASIGVELIQWNGDSTPFSQGELLSLRGSCQIISHRESVPIIEGRTRQSPE